MDLYLHLDCSVALWCWVSFFEGVVCVCLSRGWHTMSDVLQGSFGDHPQLCQYRSIRKFYHILNHYKTTNLVVAL